MAESMVVSKSNDGDYGDVTLDNSGIVFKLDFGRLEPVSDTNNIYFRVLGL
jgi:hypothetical protein